MKQIDGLWWPDDVGDRWQHALRHVASLEWAIARPPAAPDGGSGGRERGALAAAAR
jgi:hypothetical protein